MERPRPNAENQKIEAASRDIAEYVMGAPAGSGKRVAFFDRLELLKARKEYEEDKLLHYNSDTNSYSSNYYAPFRPKGYLSGPMGGTIEFPPSNSLSPEEARKAGKITAVETMVAEHMGSIDGYLDAHDEIEEKFSKLQSVVETSYKARKKDYQTKGMKEEVIQILYKIGKSAFAATNTSGVTKEEQPTPTQPVEFPNKILEEQLAKLSEAIVFLGLPEEEKAIHKRNKEREQEREKLISLVREQLTFYETGTHWGAAAVDAALIGDTKRAKENHILGSKLGGYSYQGETAALIGDIGQAERMISHYQHKGGSLHQAGRIAALIGDIETAEKGIRYCEIKGYHDNAGEIAALVGDTTLARKCISYSRKHGMRGSGKIGVIAAIIGDVEIAKREMEVNSGRWDGAATIAAWLIWADKNREMLDARAEAYTQRSNNDQSPYSFEN